MSACDPLRTCCSAFMLTRQRRISVCLEREADAEPWGFATQAQADALVARVNELKTLSEAEKVLLNEIRAALVQLGLIKGSA